MLFLLGTALSGCVGKTYFDKHSYFDGAVVVEYRQTKQRGTDDFITFRFYEKGDYGIYFKAKNGKAPKNFEITIKEVPREHVIEQYTLPDFLSVTIYYNGAKESHEFK